MAGYMDELTQQQLKHMDGAIDTFLTHYRDIGIARGDQQKTVLFFPGGLGSELSRANIAYGAAGFGGNYGGYNQFWYDVFQIQVEKRALWMQMRRQNGVDYDSEDKFILASGEFNNCVYAPYDGFVDWCGQNQLDLLVCGFDNRRNSDWLVSFFMDHLPDYARQRARDDYGIDTDVNDPLGSVYLVGHSEGGHLIKWMLNEHEHPFCQNVSLAVTVATAFYGNVSQCHRMFEGEPLVGGSYSKAELAKAIATMPGGYMLFFLDEETYVDHRVEFEADVYPLAGYPSVDSVDNSIRVDPYVNARRGNNEYRYHTFGWDLGPYIDEGLKQFKRTVEDLDPSMKDLFHNIRGVQVQGGQDLFGTVGSLTWSWIRDNFDPDTDTSPIKDSPNKVPGDGVVPAWSARLLPAQDGRVHTVWGEEQYFEHMTLMESDGVLAKLWELLQTGQPRRESRVIMARRQIEPAPVIELKRTMLEIQEVAERARVEKKEVVDVVNAYIASIKPDTQKALVKRWFIEMAKGPGREEPDPPKKEAPPREKMDSPKRATPTKEPKKRAAPKGQRGR
jgi:hypothetical protein